MKKYDSYEDLRSELSNLPVTWYPALISHMIKVSYKKNVWLPGGASIFVNVVEKEEGFNEYPTRTGEVGQGD